MDGLYRYIAGHGRVSRVKAAYLGYMYNVTETAEMFYKSDSL